MKFTRSEIYFILYILLTVASAFLDLTDDYSSRLKEILNKIAKKTDDEVKNESK